MGLKVGIIGTGFGSLVHYPGFFHHPEFEPEVIVGQNPSKTKAIAKRLDAPRWSTDWREVIADPEIDVVSVVTPPKYHLEMVMAAVESNKHILCEKPVSVTLKDAERMRMAIEEHGNVGMVNLEFRYIPNRAYLVELLKSGYIGKIHDFTIILRNSSRLNPRDKGYNWWSERAEGGGVLYSVGAHYIDLLIQVFNRIDRVYGKPSTLVERRLNKKSGKMKRVTADDSFSAIFEIGDGATGIVQVSSVSPFGKGTRIEFYGNEGYLGIDEHGRLWGARLSEDEKPHCLEIPHNLSTPKIEGTHPLVGPFMKLLYDFWGAIKMGRSLSPNFNDAYNLQRVLTALQSSSSSGKAMNLGPFQ